MATLPSSISGFSEDEKFRPIDALWEDLEARSQTVSAEQAEELDRRIAAYEEDPSAVTPGEEVKAGLPER